MKNTTILHITDLHYNEPYGSPQIVGKDKNVTNGLINKISSNDCRESFISFARYYNSSRKIDLVAFTGDLGWAADPESVERGADFLAKLAKDLSVSSRCVVVAPGNHDLNRDERDGKELECFCRACEKRHFRYAHGEEPFILDINNFKVVALNSCLGGTERAIKGVPDDYWKIIQKTLSVQKKKLYDSGTLSRMDSDLRFQLEAMDIPAIGIKQLEQCNEVISRSSADFFVLLMHHNLIPATNIEIRAYASSVDAGRTLSRLLNYERYIMVLHGHSHTNIGLRLQRLKDDKPGYVACIGNRGLSPRPDSEASIIEIMTTDDGNFVRAETYNITRNGTEYESSFNYMLSARPDQTLNPTWSFCTLPKGVPMSFAELAKKLNVPKTDKLAKELIQLDAVLVNVTNKQRSPKYWQITRKI